MIFDKDRQSISFYLFIGLFPFSLYSIYHFYFGLWHIGLVSLLDAIVIGWGFYLNNKKPLSNNYLNFCFVFSVAYICFFLGVRGLIYVFPILVGFFYHYGLKKAFYGSVTFAVVCLLALISSVELDLVIRSTIPVAITIVFSDLYAKQVYKQRSLLI